ncbi:YdcF family protein [Acinetobacter larvae]|uniref:DUF218 domain-containing protein n=1 Tax=Acinetobacter larvae TaxID=1789224 RepID=A0A1B2LYP8_9GAMM|nr:YdcF family protein [Acinetobacter larvae]AOA58009.1 hypothetical protein BFG52_06355 [Acinetobacter larvae]
MTSKHGIVGLLRIFSVLLVIFAAVIIFWYTPFYSNMVVKLLDRWVPVQVNQVAAKSQRLSVLSDHENLEPGSDLWIARQAYLNVLQQHIQQQRTQQLPLIHARYKILREDIIQARNQQEPQQAKPPFVPKLMLPSSDVVIDGASEVVTDFPLEAFANKDILDQYQYFLEHHQVPEQALLLVDDALLQDIAQVNPAQATHLAHSSKNPAIPYAIVVLGGGLVKDPQDASIIPNAYTELRLKTTMQLEKSSHLPIVLSGVEAPYMQKWLAQHGVQASLLENKSMNTCENTRFSSLLLQKKGGAPTVYLVTDRYHMPRTRRLFALSGIETIPVDAPMPTQLTAWQPSKQNYDHSRRANYELLATIRDMLIGSSGCREVP